MTKPKRCKRCEADKARVKADKALDKAYKAWDKALDKAEKLEHTCRKKVF